MAVVLVTGGTGTLGRRLLPRLLAAGHEVRCLSRRPSAPEGSAVTCFVGDVRTGAGVAAALEGVDVVVHAASNPYRHVRETEVEGARAVAAEAARRDVHVVYVSIVGVDRHRYRYFRAKRAAEIVVERSGAPWSVLRATQFHDLIERFLAAPVFPRTPNLRFQPIDVDEVAARLVQVVAERPPGLLPDFGGPEVVAVTDLAEARRQVTGRRARLVPAPRVGFLADFDAGRHLTPDHRDGRRTWRDWLAGG